MILDWNDIDRWLMGEAWVGSRILSHLQELCDRIGPRWASTPEEREAAEYIRGQFEADGLADARLEEFELQTWSYDRATARVQEEDGPSIPILPYLWCPPTTVSGPLVDIGFGTAREIAEAGARLRAGIAVVDPGLEPFTTPVPFPIRLQAIAKAGARAVVGIDRKTGGRLEFQPAIDWRRHRIDPHPAPTVNVSRETGLYLRRLSGAGKNLAIEVESRFYTAPAANVLAELTGARWPDRHIVLGGHHDTVWHSPGGNDNASGTAVVLEAARVLSRLAREKGIRPGCTIRFATWTAEEQMLQGSTAYVRRHYGTEKLPLLMVNLDELSTGNMKGVILQFPHLREFVQQQLDSMQGGLVCHVMSQMDAWSDHFSFSLRGIPSAILWRWRFFGRYPEADYHHEHGDTLDKVRVRDLKEYAGLLSRLLLRLSQVPPGDWPPSAVEPRTVEEQIAREIGTIHRTFH
ncbi:MAG: M28 family peptidase [Chloroflexi bacterium]|nr:M28 family peptidase [Chloroflexota bacterium]